MVKKMTKIKRGPKPTGNALTPTERKRRQRAKQTCLIKAADESGFCPRSVLISNKQLLSLAKFEYLRNGGNTPLDDHRLNEIVFYALKGYLSRQAEFYTDKGFDQSVIDECVYMDKGSSDYNALMGIQVEATKLFEQWEKQQ